MTSGEEKALLAILAERIEEARTRGKSTTIELLAATHRADMLALATLEPKPDELRCQCVASHAHRRWGDFVVGPRCAADAVTTVIKRGEHGGVELRMCRECSDFHAKPEPKRGVEEILAEVLCHDRLQAYFPHIREHIYDALRLYREERERDQPFIEAAEALAHFSEERRGEPYEAVEEDRRAMWADFYAAYRKRREAMKHAD